jgi:fatty-acyl-CoA synthase
MSDISFGSIYARLREVVDPARPALIHGDRTISWGEYDRRTSSLAAAFLAAGAVPG